MTRHRLTNIALSLGLAVALAAILGSSHLLDDNSAEWAQSTALRDAQQQAQAEARRERAAQQLCVRLRGPNAAHRWTPDGELVCSHNKGQGAVSVAKVAL
jgi:hypothetical protein